MFVYVRIMVLNTYWVVFLFCLSLSFVPYVANISGLYIFDCRLHICISVTWWLFIICKTWNMWLEYLVNKSTSLENTEGAIKNVQSREIGNIGYKRQRQTNSSQQSQLLYSQLIPVYIHVHDRQTIWSTSLSRIRPYLFGLVIIPYIRQLNMYVYCAV
jgi:hypothetical protein